MSLRSPSILMLISLHGLGLLMAAGCGARTGLLEADEHVGELEQESCVHPQVVKDCNDGWCMIPAGCFYMGDEPGSVDCTGPGSEVIPQVEVTLTRSFEIAQTEVTLEQFESTMGFPPPNYDAERNEPITRADCPDCAVHDVDWSFAVQYCNRLSQARGLETCYATITKSEFAEDIHSCQGYRLPTAAEWEYAYRAGSTTALYSGPLNSCGRDENANAIGWYLFNAQSATTPMWDFLPREVGKKTPNAWGLHDMAGNVWEWVHDAPTEHVAGDKLIDPQRSRAGSAQNQYQVKGGSVLSHALFLRHGYYFQLHGGSPIFIEQGLAGFRCARTLDVPAKGGAR